MKHLPGLLGGALSIGLLVNAQSQESTPPKPLPATPTPTPTNVPRVKFIDLPNLTEKSAATTNNRLVMIEGATYLVFGDTLVPLPGGGASGCLDKDASATAARLARARAAYAQQLKKD